MFMLRKFSEVEASEKGEFWCRKTEDEEEEREEREGESMVERGCSLFLDGTVAEYSLEIARTSSRGLCSFKKLSLSSCEAC